VKKSASADHRTAVLMALTAWDVVSNADKHGTEIAPMSEALHAENGIC